MKHALFAVVMLLSVSAQAEPYALASVGGSRTDAAGSEQTTFTAAIGLGFQINKALAVEAAYTDFDIGRNHNSHATSTSSTGAGFTSNVTKREWRGSGGGLYLVGLLPARSFSWIGRIGAVRMTSETKTATDSNFFPPVGTPVQTRTEETASERIWAPAVGVGIQETTGGKAAFRAMLERVGGRHGEFKSSTTLSVSLIYSF